MDAVIRFSGFKRRPALADYRPGCYIRSRCGKASSHVVFGETTQSTAGCGSAVSSTVSVVYDKVSYKRSFYCMKPKEELLIGDVKYERSRYSVEHTVGVVYKKVTSDSLHVCAKNNNIEEAEKLLKRGVDPDALDSKGRTPLAYSIVEQYSEHPLVFWLGGLPEQIGSPGMVELLLSYGADANKVFVFFKNEGNHVEGTPFGLLVRRKPVNYLRIAELLLKAGNKEGTKWIKQEYLSCHLFSAVYRYDSELVELLLQNGVDPNAVESESWPAGSGWCHSALDLAIQKKQPAIIEVLLKYGAKTDIALPRMVNDRLAQVEQQLNDLQARDDLCMKMQKSIQAGAQDSRADLIVDCPSAFFAMVSTIYNKAVCHSLHSCISNGNIGKAKKLLKQGVNPDTADREGRTPLAYALLQPYPSDAEPVPTGQETGSPEMVDLLLSYGADSNKSFTWFNGGSEEPAKTTPFDVLISRKPDNYLEIAERMLKAENKEGVKWIKQEQLSDYLFKSVNGCSELVELLLKNGANANDIESKVDTIGWHRSVLNLVIETKQLNIVKVLLEYGANTNCVSFRSVNDQLALEKLHLTDLQKLLDLCERMIMRLSQEESAMAISRKDLVCCCKQLVPVETGPPWESDWKYFNLSQIKKELSKSSENLSQRYQESKNNMDRLNKIFNSLEQQQTKKND